MELVQKIKSFVFTKHFLKHSGLIALTYLLVVGGMILYLDGYTHHGEKIEVPKLVGKNVKHIQALLEEKGLNYEIVEQIYDPKKPEGTILEQDPLPTTSSLVYVKEGRIIKLRVSKKTDLVEMPTLIDNSQRFAESVLKNRGLKYRIEYTPSFEAHGAVLKQMYKGKQIKGGTKIPIGSIVTLVVGRNELGDPVQVPDCYGLTIEEARNMVMGVPTLLFNPVCDGCITTADSLAARVQSQSPEFIDGVLSPAGTTVTIYATPNFVDERNAEDDNNQTP